MISALCMGVGYIITSFIAYPEGEIGRYLCMFVIGGDLAWIGAAESILCLVYIAVERYFAILRPLRQRGRFTRRRLRVFIVLGWSFAIVLRVPTSLEVRYYHSDLRMCNSESAQPGLDGSSRNSPTEHHGIPVLQNSASLVVQTGPQLRSFPEGFVTLSQTSYHNTNYCQYHLRGLLDSNIGRLPRGLLE